MNVPNDTRVCANCVHTWVEDAKRMCRAHPPQITFLIMPQARPDIMTGRMANGVSLEGLSGWPIVQATHSCGEFWHRQPGRSGQLS